MKMKKIIEALSIAFSAIVMTLCVSCSSAEVDEFIPLKWQPNHDEYVTIQVPSQGGKYGFTCTNFDTLYVWQVEERNINSESCNTFYNDTAYPNNNPKQGVFKTNWCETITIGNNTSVNISSNPLENDRLIWISLWVKGCPTIDNNTFVFKQTGTNK